MAPLIKNFLRDLFMILVLQFGENTYDPAGGYPGFSGSSGKRFTGDQPGTDCTLLPEKTVS
jgi:hypothetical protein